MAKLAVFVHLSHAQDAEKWRAKSEEGSLVGINDPTPYGYGRAEEMGCDVRFSEAIPENIAQKALRLGLRVLLGFDLQHAIRNRKAIMQSDVVWTHTESQFLGAAALLTLYGKTDTPRIVGQAVWLMDEWPRLGFVRRAIVRRLIRRIDVLTVHSPLNLALAKTLFPHTRSELVRFGIPTEYFEEPAARQSSPLRVLCVGNDRHRDWKTVVKAVRGRPDLSLTIISQTADPALVRDTDNAEIKTVSNNGELLQAYRNADVLVMPLRPNLHASGLTVIQEAALMGVPIIATEAGGLDSYFDPSQVRYVPPFDSAAIGDALSWVAANPREALGQANRAQARIRSGAIGCAAYVKRHVELSRELTGRGGT